METYKTKLSDISGQSSGKVACSGLSCLLGLKKVTAGYGLEKKGIVAKQRLVDGTESLTPVPLPVPTPMLTN